MKDFIQYPNDAEPGGKFSSRDRAEGLHLLNRDAVCWVCKRQQGYYLYHCRDCGRILDLSCLFRDLISRLSPKK